VPFVDVAPRLHPLARIDQPRPYADARAIPAHATFKHVSRLGGAVRRLAPRELEMGTPTEFDEQFVL
jgi:hypothetical protein